MNITDSEAVSTAPRGLLPSKHYLELLGRVHRALLPRTYAEVGVSTGRSLSLCLPGTRALGIDPEPYVMCPVSRSAKVVRLASDEFFRRHTAQDFFGDSPLDLAFIDGMHVFEFALRDFINLEKWCAPDSVILIHDCYPMDEASASRVRTTRVWTGDVWKLVLCLKEFRPELEVSTVNVPPSGLCIVTGLDPASPVLESRYAEICERYVDLPYGVIAERADKILNGVPNDWTAVQRLLPSEPFRKANVAGLALARSLRVPQRDALLRLLKRSLVKVRNSPRSGPQPPSPGQGAGRGER